MANPTNHRPIIIQGLEDPLDKKDINGIKDIYSTIEKLLRELDALNHRYREIIGSTDQPFFLARNGLALRAEISPRVMVSKDE